MLFYSFQNILKFSTCFFTVFRTFWNFNMLFLQFSEHNEIFNMLFHSFQNILKFSTCFFTVFRTFWNFNMLFLVFRTYWNFQHAFSHFSEHAEIFNIVLNTLFQYAYNMHYRFQHALKFSTHFQTWKFKTFTVKFYFYVVQIYVNQGSFKLSMTDHYGGQVNNWPHSHTPQISM